MKIAVIGTGHVGLVTGVCFAQIGHSVICQDSNGEKIDSLQNANIPFYEPYLENLVRENMRGGRLLFTKQFEEATGPSEVVFICVGTPPLENGEADLSAVERVSMGIAEVSDSYKLVVEKSTVPVQTGMWVEKTLKIYGTRGIEFDVASNPEFLREGSAVEDFLHPDRIVVGIQTAKASKILQGLYDPIISGRFKCPIHSTCIPTRKPCPFIITDINSAELIKHASNSFLANKISFINALANICEKTGANIKDVAYGMSLDPRIGESFLEAGIGFGGFCFPKDIQAFIRISERCGYDFNLLKEVEKINKERVSLVVEKLKNALWVLKGKTIGILGLAFKPNTDDIRFAPALEIIKQLLKEGVFIKAYDPKAMENASKEMPEISYCSDPYKAAEDSDALVICTEWLLFKKLELQRIREVMRRPLILDGRNIYDKGEMTDLGFEYLGMGT